MIVPNTPFTLCTCIGSDTSLQFLLMVPAEHDQPVMLIMHGICRCCPQMICVTLDCLAERIDTKLSHHGPWRQVLPPSGWFGRGSIILYWCYGTAQPRGLSISNSSMKPVATTSTTEWGNKIEQIHVVDTVSGPLVIKILFFPSNLVLWII